MRRIATTTKRNVVLLTDPDAEFVSFVDHGANQRPLKVTKADAPLSVRTIKTTKQTNAMPKTKTKFKSKEKKGATAKPTATKKSSTAKRTPNKKGDDKNAPDTGVDVHRITFSKKQYATKAEVENYLDANGYRDYTIKEERGQWVMPGRDIEDFKDDSVEELDGEEDGVSIFSGELKKNAAEGNSKSKPKPEKLPKKKPTSSPVAKKSKAKKKADDDEDEAEDDSDDDQDDEDEDDTSDEDESDDADEGDDDSDDSDDSDDDEDDTDEDGDDDSDDEDESDDEEDEDSDDGDDDEDSDDDEESDEDDNTDDEEDSDDSDDDEDDSEDEDESDDEDDSDDEEDEDEEESKPAKKKKPAPKSKAKKGEDGDEDDSDDDDDEETAQAFKGRKGRPGKVHKMKKGKVPSKSVKKSDSPSLRSVVKKLDYYGTQSSRSASLTGVLKDGEGDLPPGVDDIFFAARIALRNSFRKEGSARNTAIDELGVEFSKVVKRIAAAFDAVEKSAAKGKKHPLRKWVKQFIADDATAIAAAEKHLVAKSAALADDEDTEDEEDESPGASRAPKKEKKLAATDIQKAVENGLGQVTKTLKKSLSAFEDRLAKLESQRQRKQALTDADDDDGEDDGRERQSKDADDEEDAEFEALMLENKTGLRVTRSKARAKR